jgi:hypothetical protein
VHAFFLVAGGKQQLIGFALQNQGGFPRGIHADQDDVSVHCQFGTAAKGVTTHCSVGRLALNNLGIKNPMQR